MKLLSEALLGKATNKGF